MATPTSISVEEYLQTSYRPDREYIGGELRERNVGKWEHARMQWLLANWFAMHEGQWGVMGSTEQRVAVGVHGYRVPDLVVVLPGPQPDILVDPPLLVVEILSPGDTYAEIQQRAADYRGMGVETVWIIDTQTRTGRMCIGEVWTASDRLEVPGTPVFVQLSEMFEFLNRPKA